MAIKGLENFTKIWRDLKGRFKRLNKIEQRMDEALIIGQRVAKENAPVLTGLLRKSIDRSITKRENIYIGRIFVDLSIVPYARRQNIEHKTKSLFMEKGMRAARRHIEGVYSNIRRFESDFFND